MNRRACTAAFVLAAKQAARARGELAVNALFYIVLIVIFAALWHAAIQTNGTVAGYSATALIWYMVASEGAVVPTTQRLIEHVANDIINGAVHTEMLRPTSVVGIRIAAELGSSLTKAVAVAAVGVPLGLLLTGAPPDLSAAVLAAPAIVLAISCSIVSQYAFAAIAFWQRDAKASWFIYQKFIFLLGGMLLPLQILPGWLQDVAWSLPFWTMAYAPARLLSGHNEPLLLAGQVTWLAALLLLAIGVFALGERRLQAAGG